MSVVKKPQQSSELATVGEVLAHDGDRKGFTHASHRRYCNSNTNWLTSVPLSGRSLIKYPWSTSKTPIGRVGIEENLEIPPKDWRWPRQPWDFHNQETERVITRREWHRRRRYAGFVKILVISQTNVDESIKRRACDRTMWLSRGSRIPGTGEGSWTDFEEWKIWVNHYTFLVSNIKPKPNEKDEFKFSLFIFLIHRIT